MIRNPIRSFQIASLLTVLTLYAAGCMKPEFTFVRPSGREAVVNTVKLDTSAVYVRGRRTEQGTVLEPTSGFYRFTQYGLCYCVIWSGYEAGSFSDFPDSALAKYRLIGDTIEIEEFIGPTVGMMYRWGMVYQDSIVFWGHARFEPRNYSQYSDGDVFLRCDAYVKPFPDNWK